MQSFFSFQLAINWDHDLSLESCIFLGARWFLESTKRIWALLIATSGECELGDACGYCHFTHAKSPSLDKRQRTMMRNMDTWHVRSLHTVQQWAKSLVDAETWGSTVYLLSWGLPVVPARGGAEVALGIYKTFLIYRTCMRRAPAKPVRACILRKWCPVSHVTFEAPLRTSHFTLLTALFTLHTSRFTLQTSHFTLHSSHSRLHTSHFTVHTSHFSILTAFFTLHASLFTLHTHTPHFTLHTALFTLHTAPFTPHTSHFTLHTALFTLHTALFTPHTSHLHFISTHLIWALLISSHLFSYVI